MGKRRSVDCRHLGDYRLSAGMGLINMIWFISDTHFGHKNVIKYCNRPFSSIEEMDEVLIQNWNSVVAIDDIVWHLGDFCFGGKSTAEKCFNRLNGIIKILHYSFHHDRHWLGHSYRSKWGVIQTFPPMVVLDPEETSIDVPIVLCHYPIHVWDREHYGAIHLYGHVHYPEYKIPAQGFSLNVGVDCSPRRYFPTSLDDVIRFWTSVW